MPNMLRIAAPIALVLLAACSSSESSLTDPASATPDTASSPALGARRVFPADNPWNADISSLPVDPGSAPLIASCGLRNLHPD
ncbi:MAG TPA: hypothetical protein VF461_02445, partial [Gemmatimonadaceae bacterium]